MRSLRLVVHLNPATHVATGNYTAEAEGFAIRTQGLESVLQSEHLANIRKAARPLFNFVHSADYPRLLLESVRNERPTFARVKQLSTGLIDQLVDEYRAGASVYELQKRHGVHRSTIAKHLKHRGVELGKQFLKESEVARVRELYDQRLSLNAIGRELGRDPKTIKAAIVK